MPPFQFAQDDLAVAIDVGADLHHRDLAIATRQRDQARLGHDHRLDDRAPGQALDAERHAHLLAERRAWIVVKDDLVAHRAHSPSDLVREQAGTVVHVLAEEGNGSVRTLLCALKR